eukprot:SAG31_NODE_356_length_17180_cov_7.595925_5_plen_40_part_00
MHKLMRSTHLLNKLFACSVLRTLESGAAISNGIEQNNQY